MTQRFLLVRSISLFLTLVSVALATAEAQTLVTTMKLGRDELGLVKTSQGISTKISFPERINEIICGDLYDPGDGRGNFVIQRSDRDLFLKPVKSTGVSNLFVKTGEQGEYTYSFELLVVPVTQSFRIVNIINRLTIEKAVSKASSLPPAVAIAASMIGVVSPPHAPSIPGIGLGTTYEVPPPPTTGTPNPSARRDSSSTAAPINPSTTRVELQSEAIKREKPPYPYLAQKAGVTGQVVVEVVVNEEGRVTESRAVSGPLLLREAAVNAARSWKFRPFRPTKLDGIPVQAVGTITFVFHPPSSP
jgi:TonB family protein